MEVNIINFNETRVALLEHRGAPALINESAMKFIEWRKQTGLSPVKTSKTFGIAYDDPEQTEPEAFRFDICGSVSDQPSSTSHLTPLIMLTMWALLTRDPPCCITSLSLRMPSKKSPLPRK